MTTLFIAPQHQSTLEINQLNDFDAIWNFKVAWFEEPNMRRGGWSGVGRLQLEKGIGTPLCLFVKKQQNHGRRTLLHPISGEPTFRREFKRLQYLMQHGIAAPKVVFYDEKMIDKQLCAILVTEELTGYEPLDVCTERLFMEKNVTRTQKQILLKAIATSLRQFHQLGLVHRALYPKHIFVKDAFSQPKIALIDLEKARFSFISWYRAYFDLSALHRHTEGWSYLSQMAFLHHYFGVKKLGVINKWFCRMLLQRANR